MRIQIANYRIIEKADLEIEGITLIRGQNDSGKSCVMRALRTSIMNASSDDQIRYGSPGFLVDLEVNNRKLTYSRKRKGSPLLSFDSKTPIEKLGRLSISDLDPTFPLKTLKFSDGTADGTEKFLPNFVFQGQTPVFGQVDIYAFFSAMFESVSRLSRHLLVVRKRASDSDSQANAAKARVDSLQEMSVSLQQRLSEFDEALLTESKAKLDIGLDLQRQEAVKNASVASLGIQLASLSKYLVLANVDFLSMASRHEAATRLIETFTRQQAAYLKATELTRRLGYAQAAEASVSKVSLLLTAARMVSSIRATQDKIRHLPDMEVLVRKLEAATTAAAAAPKLQSLLSAARLHEALGDKSRLLSLSSMRLATYVRRVGHLESSVLPVIPLLSLRSSIVRNSRRHEELSGSISAFNADLELLKAQLLDVKTCPVCASPLEHSLTHYIGGLS